MSFVAVAVAGIGAGTSLLGSGIAASGGKAAAAANAYTSAGNAANTYELGKEGLDLQTKQWLESLKLLTPTVQTGQGAMANLAYLLGIPVQGNLYQMPNVQTPGSIPDSALPADLQAKLSTLNFYKAWLAGENPVGQDGKHIGQAPKNPATIAKVTSQIQQLQTEIDGAKRTLAWGGSSGTAGNGQETPLSSLVNTGLGEAGSLGKPISISESELQSDPSYKFRVSEGMKALERSAASRGDILSGGTAKELERYGQDMGSQEYQNVWNRKAADQANQFNRLASLMGIGQTTANTLSSTGNQFGNNASNTLQQTGQQVNNDLSDATAARASGYQNASNIWGNAVSGIGSNISQLLLLKNLFNNSASTSGGVYGGG